MTALSAAVVLAMHQLDVVRARLQDVLTLSTDVEGEARQARQVRPLGITERERQVLVLLGQGMANKEIAVEAGIAEQTVKNNLKSIYRKLGVFDRVQAALLAHDLELVPELAPHLQAYVAAPLSAASLRHGPHSRLGTNYDVPRPRAQRST